MAGKLILHIGHFKTGTTALQVFLSQNDALLLQAGLDYPRLRRHNAKHSAFAFALLRAAGARRLMHGYADPVPPEVLWEELFTHLRRSPAGTVLVSSEEFMRLALFPAAEARLGQILARHGAGIEIEALAWLRPPQPHLRSWYNQLVKMGETVPDYPAALQGAIEPIHIDYGLALAPWRRLLGDDRVVLRPYRPRGADPAALFRDVLEALGRALPAGAVLPEKDPNPRLDDRLVELVRLLQNAGHSARQIERLCRSAGRYLDALPAEPPADARAEGIAAVGRQVAAGIDALAGLPRSTLDLDALRAALPAPVPEDGAVDSRLLGLVLAEVVQLRQRVERLQPDALEKRLARLEALLEARPGRRE